MEVEHKHSIRGQEGMVRVLAFRNHENMGRFSDAIAAFEANPEENATTCTGFNYGSQNADAPDLCWVAKTEREEGHRRVRRAVHRTRHWRVRPRNVLRRTDRSVRLHVRRSVCRLWEFWRKVPPGRARRDVTGIGGNLGWISNIHAKYLGMGGVDGFVGDGAITAAAEDSLDMFYSASLRQTVLAVRRLPAHRKSRLQCRPWPGQHLYRENPWRVLNHIVAVPTRCLLDWFS